MMIKQGDITGINIKNKTGNRKVACLTKL